MTDIDLWVFMAKAIHNLRLRSGMTIEELSGLVGLDADALQAFEMDTRGLEIETLEKICSVLQTEALTLFNECPLSKRYTRVNDLVELWAQPVC